MIAIIKNSDNPALAEFEYDDFGEKLIFKDHEEAEQWLDENAESGVGYRHFDGND